MRKTNQKGIAQIALLAVLAFVALLAVSAASFYFLKMAGKAPEATIDESRTINYDPVSARMDSATLQKEVEETDVDSLDADLQSLDADLNSL